mmetsp:Transcript_20682/g.31304  ORF Transcript_20682/g.31304 Transcript_20682/m.31304 type:complete len:123 (-) Transcript_20682:92-460(-)
MRIKKDKRCSHDAHQLISLFSQKNRSCLSEIEKSPELTTKVPNKIHQVKTKRVHFAKTGTRRTIPSLDPRSKHDLFYSPRDYCEFRQLNADQKKGMFVIFDLLLGMSNHEGEKVKALYQSHI